MEKIKVDLTNAKISGDRSRRDGYILQELERIPRILAKIRLSGLGCFFLVCLVIFLFVVIIMRYILKREEHPQHISRCVSPVTIQMNQCVAENRA